MVDDLEEMENPKGDKPDWEQKLEETYKHLESLLKKTEEMEQKWSKYSLSQFSTEDLVRELEKR